jgi:hypothetical protein
MKLTTAGQAGSRDNGPALTHFRDVGEEGMAVPEMVYRVAARRVDSRSRRGFSIAAPHSWYLPIDASAYCHCERQRSNPGGLQRVRIASSRCSWE